MTIPDSHRDLLDWETRAFANVATIGPDGEPQNNPVWFDFDGDVVKISQTTGRQKYRNVRKDGRVALSILDPENPYRYLEIRGEVERIEDDDDNAFINSMASKYLGKDTYPWHQPEDHRVVLRIRPKHTTTMG